jgi:hypothetical protein
MRSVLVAAVGLVLVASACTSATTETSTSLAEEVPTTTSTTEAPEDLLDEDVVPPTDEGYLWSIGDCVDLGANEEIDLPYAPYGTDLLADCAEAHTHEVFFTTTLSEGPDEPFPDDLNDRLWNSCYVEFAGFMGFSSSDSTLTLLLYLPDADEWADGERYHACVVYQLATDAVYGDLSGSAAADPDAYRWHVGTGLCFDAGDLQVLVVTDAVDCAAEHTFEMIGEVSLGPSGAEYPGIEAIDAESTEACDGLLEDYAAQSLDDLPVLTLYQPIPFAEGEWEVGQRTVRCFAFAATRNQGLIVVVGSLGEGTLELIEVEDDEGVSV